MPLLETRAGGEVAAALRQSLGWPQPPQPDLLAEALVAVFAHYATLLGGALNAAPQRHLDAFVDLLQPERFAAEPAQTVLVFEPVPRPAGRAGGPAPVVPAGTRVAGQPAPGASEPPLFETVAPLALQAAQVVRAHVVDAAGARWADAGAIAQPQGLAEPLPLQALPRALYLPLPPAALAPAATLVLQLDFDGEAPAPAVLDWCLQGPQGAPVPLVVEDGTLGLSRSGELLLQGLAPADPGPHWLVGRLASGAPLRVPRQVRWTLRRVQLAAPLEAAFFGPQPLDASCDFFPLGERPRFGDAVLLRAAAFAWPGAQVDLAVQLTNGLDAEGTPPIPRVGDEHAPRLQWDAWTAAGWTPLQAQDGTEGFTRSGRVRLTLPAAVQPMDWQGTPGGFLRARLASGDYQVMPKPVVAAPANSFAAWQQQQPLQRPPAIARLEVAAQVQAPPQVLDGTEVEQGLQRTLSAARQQAGPGLYLGLRRDAAEAGTQLQCVLQGLGGRPPALPRCQYRGPDGWRDAAVRSVPCPQADALGCVWTLGPDWSPWPASTVDAGLLWLRLVQPDDAGGEAAPRLARVLLNAVGALQQATVEDELLGSSNGAPLQQFAMARGQVLGEPELEVGEDGLPAAERQALVDAQGVQALRVQAATGRLPERCWVRWQRVDDFSASGPQSRHYLLDRQAGRVQFGDGRRGRVPPPGPNNLLLRRYRSGGGAAGNAPAQTVTQLRSTRPYVAAVQQPDAARGGQDAETPASARAAATAWLRHRGRAVGPDDYADLACRAEPGIARALCLPARDLAADPSGERPAPGRVSLAVLPRDATVPQPQPAPALLQRIRGFLQARCPASVRLQLVAPQYLALDLELEIAPLPDADPAALAEACAQRLRDFLHPVAGGPAGDGWAFGRRPHLSELRAALRGLAGLGEVRQLRQRPAQGAATQAPHALVCAGRCTVRTVDAVGIEV
ncbi:putative baseplate assembly protein [Pseudorhodoferax sp.]|uniref:putative baseplate assembly protein n=1 Tax=Pseudorhodoferax sp. TaxID=1993553 RepID=UPI002DD67D64|nr:putative baseplate assembly protein [Pseudorhodoferax sp.]